MVCRGFSLYDLGIRSGTDKVISGPPVRHDGSNFPVGSFPIVY